MIEKLGMPKWGLSMTEGRVIDWLVEEGAEIAVGDEVAEVETEKINGVVEAPVAGVLRRRVAASYDVIPVGGLLGVIADASVPEAEIDAFVAEFEASFVPGEKVPRMIPRRANCSIAGRSMMRADSARQTRKKARLALARIFVPELEEATSSGTIRSQGFSLLSPVRDVIGAVGLLVFTRRS